MTWRYHYDAAKQIHRTMIEVKGGQEGALTMNFVPCRWILQNWRFRTLKISPIISLSTTITTTQS